jgi:prevent-host-death family protein
MSTLTFRNRLGELVDVPSVAATRLKNEFGAVLEEAARGAVAITRHDAPKAVLVSYDEFRALVNGRSQSLSELDGEFDALLERMQSPKAKKGVEAAFRASPAELGRVSASRSAAKTAVKPARRRRR